MYILTTVTTIQTFLKTLRRVFHKLLTLEKVSYVC